MKAKEFCLRKFLNSNMISLDGYDFASNLESYINEMQAGLDGKSSIPMLPTFIEDREIIPAGKSVLVLDAGGTNFRVALVKFTENNEAKISGFKKMGMPGVEEEHSREEFFDAIADFIAELAVGVERIGFCFSYPMVKTIEKDGRLIEFSKEIKAPEVVGELIGQGVLEALKKRGITNIKKIVLLNDTVATLLAGKASGRPGEFDGFIGLILGTGINASYNEQNSNIGKKVGMPSDGSQLINMEAGACGVLPSGPADARYRSGTANPDAYKFEKMVSGGYLGSLWFSILKSAANEGCFSESFKIALESAEKSGAAKKYDTSDLSRFLSETQFPQPLASAASADDIGIALSISQAVTRRAAYLASVMIAGIVTKTGKGHKADKPVCICVDGTTFWKLSGLKAMIEQNLDEYFSSAGLYYRIIGIENAPVIGAAVAGLTND